MYTLEQRCEVRLRSTYNKCRFCQKIIFSVETHFDLGGYINKQNCRIWGTENPHAYIEKPTQTKSLFGADFGPEAKVSHRKCERRGFFIIGIERRGNFSGCPSHLFPELHIPSDDRCSSNLTDIQGPPNEFFIFGKCLKKLLNIFSNFFFYLKVQSFWLITTLTGHAVAYKIASVFKHIIDCVQLYFTNGFTNIVL